MIILLQYDLQFREREKSGRSANNCLESARQKSRQSLRPTQALQIRQRLQTRALPLQQPWRANNCLQRLAYGRQRHRPIGTVHTYFAAVGGPTHSSVTKSLPRKIPSYYQRQCMADQHRYATSLVYCISFSLFSLSLELCGTVAWDDGTIICPR